MRLSDGYLASGSSKSFGDPLLQEGIVMRLNLNGEVIWSRRIGSEASFEQFGEAIASRDESHFYFIGYTDGFGFGSDQSLFYGKIDSSGFLVWVKAAGVVGVESGGWSLIQSEEGPIYIVGQYIEELGTDSDGRVLKIDPESGDILASRIIGNSGDDGFRKVSRLPDGSILIGGVLQSSSSNNNLWLLTLSD